MAVLVAALAIPAAASADATLGTVTAPSGSTATACGTAALQQLLVSGSSASGGVSGPYTVPNGPPMALTQWQINATGAAAGTKAELVVFSVSVSSLSITVVGTDTETLSTAGLPASGVEAFTLAAPILVQQGELIGLYLPGTTDPGITCIWSSMSIADEVSGLAVPSAPVTGQTIPLGSGGSGFSSNDSVLNLGATLSPLRYDAGLALTSGPANAVVGQPAVLTATVTNHGPLGGPVTFTDPVPNGLTVEAASIGSGTCTVTATVNIVTCTTDTLPSGQSTNTVIVVKPKAPGSYKDSGTVSLPSGTDPNASNNSASTTLKVGKAGAPTSCVVPKLGGASLALAKKVLPLLGCKVGKVTHAKSKKVAKGDVISTKPGAGTYALGKKITLTVSKG